MLETMLYKLIERLSQHRWASSIQLLAAKTSHGRITDALGYHMLLSQAPMASQRAEPEALAAEDDNPLDHQRQPTRS